MTPNVAIQRPHAWPHTCIYMHTQAHMHTPTKKRKELRSTDSGFVWLCLSPVELWRVRVRCSGFFSTPRSGPAFGSLPVCSTRSTAAPPKASLTAFGSGLRLHSVNSRLAQSRPLAQTPVQKRGCLSCLVPCYPYIHPGIQQAETVGHGFLSSFAELFFFSTPYNQLEFDICDWWSFMFLQHPLILFLLSWLWSKLLMFVFIQLVCWWIGQDPLLIAYEQQQDVLGTGQS